MPTNLPSKPNPPRVDLFALFAIAVGLAFFVVEIVDPAPMQIEASTIASP